MRKKYLLIAGIIWALLIGMGLYVYYKPHTSVANARPDIIVDAAVLFQDFQQDEVAANKKYLDKIIEVKGIISESTVSPGTSSVQLHAGDGPGGINCSLSNSETRTQIPVKGSLITVKGKCSGFLMDVTLVDCVIK
jgi:hypothetical protein